MKLLTIGEAATALRVSQATVRRLCKDPRFPAVRVRGQIRIKAEALDEWLTTKTIDEGVDSKPGASR